jgi:peptidyl-tRNA hydrolase
MNDRPVQQAIIVNLDSHMGLGRIVAQAAHSSILSLLKKGVWNNKDFHITGIDDALQFWMKESFTKVTFRGWGNDHMTTLQREAETLGLDVAVMQEEGIITAIAIGPDYSDKIRPVTEKLRLL